MTTPMLRQYAEVKAQAPDAVLFFRLGDFYEMFGEDAEKTAPLLDIVLTARDGGNGTKIPMCGIPHHSVEGYLQKLISLGKKVAICEQTEDPKETKGIVKREIVRIVTPGTTDGVGEENRNHYLAAVYRDKEWGLAYTDITTGDFAVFQTASRQVLQEELGRLEPAELLLPSEESLLAFTGYYTNFMEKGAGKKLDVLYERFPEQKQMLASCPAAAKAAAGLWQYLLTNMPLSGHEHILTIRFEQRQDTMLLDKWTRKNLELVESLRASENETLYGILNVTKTAFGGRLLRDWLKRPLLKKAAVIHRQQQVAAFVENTFLRQDLRKQMTHVYDLERLLGKLSYGKGSARDLLALGKTLGVLPEMRALLAEDGSTLAEVLPSLDGLDSLAAELLAAIRPEAPAGVKDGGLFQDGYNEQVDELRGIAAGGKEWLAQLEGRERERTKIRSLKIGYTRVFGYYIEVTHANAHLVPEDYQRKQTLVNAERFVTPELKEYEQKVMTAQEELNRLEYELFMAMRDRVFIEAGRILGAARALAELDVYAALAESAVLNGYVRPEITEEGPLRIVEGRHPVIEKLSSGEAFVPNDTLLSEKKHVALITGPNMAGKSTYMRQVALIVLMAQVGSFVPAQEAEISIVDCIYTRIGASDNLAEGQSTFMVEMREVSYILHNATSRSLVILDEVGRGTATFDGMSLAWAVLEYLAASPQMRAKTLFATHYHELTQLTDQFANIFNLHVAVKEAGEDIVFLHKILPGSADRSYGLQVAKLAGLPEELLGRAGRILSELESSDQHRKKVRSARGKVVQPVLFDVPQIHPILEELAKLDIDHMTAKQALDYLYDRQQRLRQEKIW